MNNVFLSLLPDPPPGFEHRIPSRRDLLSGRVALYVHSLDDVFSMLDDFCERVRGIVITSGAHREHCALGPGLWHLQVTEEMVPTLGETAACILDMMDEGQNAIDQNRNLQIELSRSRMTRKQALESYNQSTERLGRKIEDLRREIERRTRAESELMQKDFIIRSASSPISIGALDGTLTYVNPAFLAAWGYDDIEEVIGRPFWEFIRPESLRHEITDALINGEKVWKKEIKGIRKDGSLFDLHSNSATVFDDKGDPVAIMSTTVDISDRKRAEEDRLDIERQMLHAQKLESLGILAGGIAHDFNNLLMGILGNADLALDDVPSTNPARENLLEIERASKRAAELAKQMLAYSGKGQFVIEPIHAGRLLQEMANLLEVSISKKATLEYDLAGDLPTFDGDVTQIRQIIMNLITNASESLGDAHGKIVLGTGSLHCDRDYLDEASATLLAGLTEPLSEGLYVYFEVSDTGCGMEERFIERVFDPFFTTKFTGRGLGMSAVLGIVRGHRGAIRVDSTPGRGSTFRVLFPASAGGATVGEARAPTVRSGQDWSASGTILIADDAETVLAVGRRMLGRMGFQVITASDGREALESFRLHADQIVCILLDLTMPQMSGEEAFREMRSLHPDVRVLLCSGYNEQEATRHFAGKGLAGFLQKPYSMSELREKLAKILPRQTETHRD